MSKKKFYVITSISVIGVLALGYVLFTIFRGPTYIDDIKLEGCSKDCYEDRSEILIELNQALDLIENLLDENTVDECFDELIIARSCIDNHEYDIFNNNYLLSFTESQLDGAIEILSTCEFDDKTCGESMFTYSYKHISSVYNVKNNSIEIISKFEKNTEESFTMTKTLRINTEDDIIIEFIDYYNELDDYTRISYYTYKNGVETVSHNFYTPPENGTYEGCEDCDHSTYYSMTDSNNSIIKSISHSKKWGTEYRITDGNNSASYVINLDLENNIEWVLYSKIDNNQSKIRFSNRFTEDYNNVYEAIINLKYVDSWYDCALDYISSSYCYLDNTDIIDEVYISPASELPMFINTSVSANFTYEQMMLYLHEFYDFDLDEEVYNDFINLIDDYDEVLKKYFSRRYSSLPRTIEKDLEKIVNREDSIK